jgi:hypothetical protein
MKLGACTADLRLSADAGGTASRHGPTSPPGLEEVDPDMAVSIEHEDQELDQFEELRNAAATLLRPAGRSEMSMTRGGR